MVKGLDRYVFLSTSGVRKRTYNDRNCEVF